MAFERGLDFAHEELELRVPDRRDQRGLQGIDDCLVERNFVGRIRAIEFRARLAFQLSHRGGVFPGQGEIGRRSRLDPELRSEVAPLLPHCGVVVDEVLCECEGPLVFGAVGGELAGFDVECVGSIDGGPVRERCDRTTDRARCCFALER